MSSYSYFDNELNKQVELNFISNKYFNKVTVKVDNIYFNIINGIIWEYYGELAEVYKAFEIIYPKIDLGKFHEARLEDFEFSIKQYRESINGYKKRIKKVEEERDAYLRVLSSV